MITPAKRKSHRPLCVYEIFDVAEIDMSGAASEGKTVTK